MPLFFFDLTGPDRMRPDALGLSCASLEAAYLEVLETLQTDALDILARGQNPFAFTYLIRNADGQILMEVPFTDLLRGRAAAGRPRPDAIVRARDPVARSRMLREDANQLCLRARSARLRAQAAYERSRARRGRAGRAAAAAWSAPSDSPALR